MPVTSIAPTHLIPHAADPHTLHPATSAKQPRPAKRSAEVVPNASTNIAQGAGAPTHHPSRTVPPSNGSPLAKDMKTDATASTSHACGTSARAPKCAPSCDARTANAPSLTPKCADVAAVTAVPAAEAQPQVPLPGPSASAEEFKTFFDSKPEGLHIIFDVEHVHGLCKAIHACSELGIELVQYRKVEQKVPAQADHRLPPNPLDKERSMEFRRAVHKREDTQPKSYSIAKGVIVCWDKHRCFFISMRLTGCGGSKPVCLKYWKHLADAMASPVAKVGMSMKEMMNRFRSLGWEEKELRKFRADIPKQGLGIKMAGQLADVRVATSLMQPGSTIVSDADQKRQFPRENDKDKHRVKQPIKNGQEGEGMQGPAERLLRLVYQLHGWQKQEWGDPEFPSPASYSLAPSDNERLTEEITKLEVEAARELMHAYALHCQIKPLLEKLSQTQLLHSIEWPLGRVLGDMQYRGMPVDVDAVDKQLQEVKEVQDALLAEVLKVTRQNGIDNFGLPSGANPKVRELLYQKLELTPPPGAKVCCCHPAFVF